MIRYSNEIGIKLPVSKVIELFDNPDNMKHWQPGFVSFEHVSGTAGAEGAVSKLVYLEGKRRIEMLETIIKRDLPYSFSGTYTAKGVYNRIDNRFEDLKEEGTRWTAENEFEFKGFMKLMGWLMPNAFKKQSMKYMEMFKDFAENDKSVLNKDQDKTTG